MRSAFTHGTAEKERHAAKMRVKSKTLRKRVAMLKVWRERKAQLEARLNYDMAASDS